MSVDNLSRDALAKLEATLRRVCKPDRKGTLKVPEQVHKMWKKGGSASKELNRVLLECDGKKDWRSVAYHGVMSLFFHAFNFACRSCSRRRSTTHTSRAGPRSSKRDLGFTPTR